MLYIMYMMYFRFFPMGSTCGTLSHGRAIVLAFITKLRSNHKFVILRHRRKIGKLEKRWDTFKIRTDVGIGDSKGHQMCI
jgi:hypothetical protein